MNAPQQNAAAARAAAAQILLRVLTHGRYLDAALEEARVAQRAALPAELSLIQELAYGTLRWYHQLTGIADLFVTRRFKPKDRDVEVLLLLGLYQLRYLRVPEYAAVDATVAAADVINKGWAKSLLNACLRGYLRETERVEQTVAASETLVYSHPSWLIDIIRRDHPLHWQRVLSANNERPPLTLRVNTKRISRNDYLARLQAQGIVVRAHAVVESALLLEKPIPVERLPGFDEGLVSVQDAAAQLAAIWLDAQPGERVLDACAAPGGKTAHILERTPALKELTALDIDTERMQRLRLNLARLGVVARLTVGDAADPAGWWDGVPYDRILLDAPCSATGVIRRHPDIKVRRRPEDLAKLVPAQARLLDGVWPCLAQGGKLLYATCSTLSEENEHQVRGFIARHADAVAQPLGAAPAAERQILPGEDDMDGFYYACVRKR
jgi:16S rRNA (cytosine967-C5)-methyltransferase